MSSTNSQLGNEAALESLKLRLYYRFLYPGVKKDSNLSRSGVDQDEVLTSCGIDSCEVNMIEPVVIIEDEIRNGLEDRKS